ncbi:MAG: cell division protein ZapA [Phocaeicola sp.]|uniref:cell division protein ZapA n=1 Tax=Phocaeicola TaxID=909656 RepID=UPI00234EBEDA|nr:cell division protein ZapA [Phocaeicola oris]MCE2615735.1 cell division protein ZapA [Phocaeicola oris]
MDDNMLKINLLIDNDNYPMRIRRNDEIFYREAAKQINYKLNRYRTLYPQMNDKRHWAMAALELAFESASLKSSTDVKPYEEKLEELTNLIDKFIK